MINITINIYRELTSDKYIIGNEGDNGIEKFTIKIPKSYNDVDFSELNAYLLGRFSSGECEKLPLGSPQIGEDDLTYVADIPQTLYPYAGNLTISVCVEKEDGTIYWSSNPNNGFKVLQSIAADGEIEQKYPTVLQDMGAKIAHKVDKTEGKSLIADSEISRLAGITSTDGLTEGENNLYFTTERVNGAINAQKGQPGGLATLNENGMLTQNALYALEAGEAYAAKSGSALETVISGKVDKVAGKSLVDDSLIPSIPKKGAKVAEIITAGGQTSVVFNNVNLLADGGFYNIYITGGNGAQKNIYMTINGVETTENYRSSISGPASNNPTICSLGADLSFVEISIGLKKANTKPTAVSKYANLNTSTVAATPLRMWWPDNTVSNVTSIKFTAFDTSAFANDVRFALYKMGT